VGDLEAERSKVAAGQEREPSASRASRAVHALAGARVSQARGAHLVSNDVKSHQGRQALAGLEHTVGVTGPVPIGHVIVGDCQTGGDMRRAEVNVSRHWLCRASQSWVCNCHVKLMHAMQPMLSLVWRGTEVSWCHPEGGSSSQ
jgi:hypothetical protein